MLLINIAIWESFAIAYDQSMKTSYKTKSNACNYRAFHKDFFKTLNSLNLTLVNINKPSK